jgi:hypothetical protein
MAPLWTDSKSRTRRCSETPVAVQLGRPADSSSRAGSYAGSPCATSKGPQAPPPSFCAQTAACFAPLGRQSEAGRRGFFWGLGRTSVRIRAREVLGKEGEAGKRRHHTHARLANANDAN